MSAWSTQQNRGNPPAARFNELLDQLKLEFNNQHERAENNDSQLANQMHEMENIRRKLWELEQQQTAMKKNYEAELTALRRELDVRGGVGMHVGGSSHNQPPPPQVGHGSSNHFGGIMAGGGGSQGGPGLAPPPPEPAQPQGLPGHLSQAPPGPAPGLPQPPFSSYPPQSANGENHPPEPLRNAGGHLPYAGFPPQPPQPTQSPGPNRNRGPRGPPGPATPQQSASAPYPGSPHIPRPTPPPGQPHNNNNLPRNLQVGNCLAELEVETVPQNLKREGQDWYAVFNPAVRRLLDVELVHTLLHSSVVCCVRFSQDGRYVATGCNRLAQIFDVNTGEPVATLQEHNVPDDGDLYIRSVCFSPDGKYLATGAEDKVIRVWEITTGKITNTFTGHDQDIYSLDFARNGRLIASGSGDRTVRLWDVETNQQVLMLTIDDGVTTVSVSPNSQYVAAGSLDKSVRVWTIDGQMVARLEGHEGHRDSVYSVAFSPNGQTLVSGSLDKTIKMWDLSNPAHGTRCVRTFEGHKDFVLSVALTIDGQWVLSGSKDRGVQFWDPRTGTAQLMLQGHKNSVISVAPSPMGDLFATGSGDLRARIWRYKMYQGM
ncbi:WD40 repeat-like protein [Microthyrium microscopicum]|uniref:WD40 repeat-like protein n=1 Tax=Microthyrium microscopicum TaxID=703497 RepID=A0A6A6U249_9PEZI|nr:WD40 repeat-like protein [Microthyrium microscopicum]